VKLRSSLDDLYKEKLSVQKDEVIYFHSVQLMKNQNNAKYSLENFPDFQTLNDRYLVLSLLGKGGFSEVYRCWDLKEHGYVACKIHQAESNWDSQRTSTYWRHAVREYDIHKVLHHHNIIQLTTVVLVCGMKNSSLLATDKIF